MNRRRGLARGHLRLRSGCCFGTLPSHSYRLRGMGARSVDFLEASIGPASFATVDGGLTLDSGGAYHPPDDDAPGAFGRTARSCASWGPNRLPPRPMERLAGSPDEAD